MPSTKSAAKPKKAAPMKLSTTGTAPAKAPSADATTVARQARTKELIAAARKREAEMTKQGYCF